MSRRRATIGVLLALALVLGVLALPWLDRAEDLRTDQQQRPPSPAAVSRGAYLATLGHCAGCHTAPGGAAYAGGRVIDTPFGAVRSANLTPDRQAGIGRWSEQAFRRALRQGRSADGRALLPVCPYANFSLVTDADADDLWAYLRSLAPQPQALAAHDLRFPYDRSAALLLWRWLNFRPAALPQPPAGARADWARGAYLVGGLGHCSACHGQRDAWGATGGAWDLRGGEIPQQGWLAPSLLDPRQGAVSGWTEQEVVALLRVGTNAGAGVSGPMAVVVAHSTQHLRDDDARAMAEFLRRLPAAQALPPRPAAPPPAQRLQLGARLYERHCADCHGKSGAGVADGGPALAGNRALALASPVNVMRIVLGGGFGPATAGQPRPLGMPPFATLLSDDEIAAVVSHVRWRFGAQAGAVSAFDVNRQR